MLTKPTYYKSIEQYCNEMNLIPFNTVDNHIMAYCSNSDRYTIFHHSLVNGMFLVDEVKYYGKDEAIRTIFRLLRIGFNERG